MNGEIVGVNSQIYSRTGGFMGLSFAVPINVVVSVYEQLKESGRVSRGWLGVLIQDVTRELAESFGMQRPHGALVAKILPGGPAEKAGFEIGDVIIKFGDKEIIFSADLPPLVGSSKIGSKIPVEIIRRGDSKTLRVTIAELPAEEMIASAGGAGTYQSNSLNITVSNPTDAQKKEMELEEHGVIVQSVADGPGYKAGIRKGDVLLLINNQKVKDAAGFEKMIKDLPKEKSIPILVQRQGSPIFLALKLGG
jgi:serine protease Do